MMELTIGGIVHQFNFGMGFMREINNSMKMPIDGLPGAMQNMGLQYKVGRLHDNDVEALVEILNAANIGMNPRVTVPMLDAHIDAPETDIDALFSTVLDFLSKSNATKKVAAAVKEMVDKELARQAAAANK